MATKIYFYALTGPGSATDDLYVSDGTPAGTTLLYAAGQIGFPEVSVPLGNDLIFSGNTLLSTLWVSDGTPTGTKQIFSLTAPLGFFASSVGYAAQFGNKVLLVATAQGDGQSLYVSDGTSSGTFNLNLPAPPVPYHIQVDANFAALGNQALFTATGPDANQDLWITDGTVAGTRIIYQPSTPNTTGADRAISTYQELTSAGQHVVFVLNAGAGQTELWSTDGTTPGTTQIDPAVKSATELTPVFGQKVLFLGAGIGNPGGGIWITDGTTVGTIELIQFTTAGSAWSPESVVVAGNRAFFVAQETGSQAMIWVTDGTPAGTVAVTSLGLRTSGLTAGTDAPLGNNMVFQGIDSLNKVGLWITDGTAAGTHEITPANAYFLGVDPTGMVASGSQVFFNGTDATGHAGLWVTDGTAAGTTELSVPGFAAAGANPIGLVAATPPVAGGMGVLGGLSINQQLEMIYIAYFNRSADGAGYTFWEGQNVQAQNAGQPAATALTNIANAFAPQPETEALYPSLDPYLGTSNPPSLNTPAGQTALGTFITGVYSDLFDRAPDAAGDAYWVGQLSTGAVALGAAALAIANGATGSDAVEVQNKVAVGLDFTTRTAADGLGETAPLPASFLTAAGSVLSGVDGTSLNDASVTAGESATTAYINGATTSQTTALATGAVTTGTTSLASPATTVANPTDTSVITVTGSGQLIDPGTGNYTIQFLAGASADTLVLHAGGVDQVSGFDPNTDVLDLGSLLSKVGVDLNGSFAILGNYVTITDQGANALVNFDPSGHGGGSTVADLEGLNSSVMNLATLIGKGAIRIA